MKRYAPLFAIGGLGVAVLVPAFAHGAINCGDLNGSIVDIESLLCNFRGTINFSINLLSATALLVFFWGLVKYIAKADDEKAKESGKNIMIWGVISLFVMFSVFGLVNFLRESFGTTENTVITPRL